MDKSNLMSSIIFSKIWINPAKILVQKSHTNPSFQDFSNSIDRSQRLQQNMQSCHRGKNERNEKSGGNSHENTCCSDIELQLKEHFLFWKYDEVLITLLFPALLWPHLEHSEQFWTPQFQDVKVPGHSHRGAAERLPGMSCESLWRTVCNLGRLSPGSSESTTFFLISPSTKGGETELGWTNLKQHVK